MRMRFRNWEFEVDKQTTENAYKAVRYGRAEDCNCVYCQNFLSQREDIYPLEMIKFFETVGIDYNKESDVSECGELGNGLHVYNGWFHFAGQIVDFPISGSHNQVNLISINVTAKIGFWAKNYLSYFEDEVSLVQVEFEVCLPWVLNYKVEN